MSGDMGDQVFAAEALTRKRVKGGKTEYLVKWKGWSAKHNSWEPEENILDPRLIQQYNRRVVLDFTTPDKKRGRKVATPGSSGNYKSSNDNLSSSPKRKRHKSDSSLKDSKTTNLSGKKSNAADTSTSDESDEEKKKEKPKPFMRETLSGRQPKPPERYAEKKPKKKKEKSDKSSKHQNSANVKKEKKSHLNKYEKHHRKKTKEPKIPPLSSKVKKLITSSDEEDDEEDEDVEPMDTRDDPFPPSFEGIRKTSEKSSSYQRQNSAPHVHFEVTSSHPTPSSQYSPALSTSSSASSPNSLSKKIGITIKKSPNSDRTFETSLLGLSIDKEEEERNLGPNNKFESDESDEEEDDDSNDEIVGGTGGGMSSDGGSSSNGITSSSNSSSSSSNADSSSDSEVRFKSSAIIAEFKKNKKHKKNKKKQNKKKRHTSKNSIGGGTFNVTTYDKKLEGKAAKVSLIKCEENHLRGKNKNDNSRNINKGTMKPTSAQANNANIRNHYFVESDSEYETEEVYELREWYPPDYWKSNHFVDSFSHSNLNHLRRQGQEKEGEQGNNNNNKSRKQIYLTDVTVDDLTITMMETQSEQGFFKKL